LGRTGYGGRSGFSTLAVNAWSDGWRCACLFSSIWTFPNQRGGDLSPTSSTSAASFGSGAGVSELPGDFEGVAVCGRLSMNCCASDHIFSMSARTATSFKVTGHALNRYLGRLGSFGAVDFKRPGGRQFSTHSLANRDGGPQSEAMGSENVQRTGGKDAPPCRKEAPKMNSSSRRMAST
jgi:hypothetical protein